MNALKKPRRMPPRRWASLQVHETRASYVLRSIPKHDHARRTAERALTAVSALLLVGAYLMMFLPDVLLLSSAGLPAFLAPMVMVATALGLYAVATRGHTPEVRFDKLRNEVWICSRNSNGDARVQTRLSKSDIQSMYIQRPQNKSKDAAIMARLRGKARPVCLVLGRRDEIEAAMVDFCAVVRNAPDKPSRNFAAQIAPRRVIKPMKAGAAA